MSCVDAPSIRKKKLQDGIMGSFSVGVICHSSTDINSSMTSLMLSISKTSVKDKEQDKMLLPVYDPTTSDMHLSPIFFYFAQAIFSFSAV